MRKRTAPLDPAIGEVMRQLDLAIIEWESESSYRPLAAAPDWFTGKVPWLSLPFLEHFVREARRFLHDHIGGVLASDQFTVESNREELLLRARALKVDGRLVVAIERLEGASDMRPILRQARRRALEHEALTEKARAVQAPLDAVVRAVADLKSGAISSDQRARVEAVSRSLRKLQDAAAQLPPRRQRRRSSN